MTILIFGKNGQVGCALVALLKNQAAIVYLGRDDCDLSHTEQLQKILHHYQPKIIINASAYTAVDRAEVEKDLASSINIQAPRLMAQYIAAQSRGLFIHYSTDYVFADTKKTPYTENDPTGPIDQLGVYGATKLLGEEAIIDVFKGASNLSKYCILRTSWVYGQGPNFIRTILRLAKDKNSINVVSDQIGAPTSAMFLADVANQFLLAYLANPNQVSSGIYHSIPHGSTSWHGLAHFVIEIAHRQKLDLMLRSDCVRPIPAIEYPVPTPRPYNSRLSNHKLQNFLNSIQSPLKLQDWQIEVKDYVQAIVASTR